MGPFKVRGPLVDTGIDVNDSQTVTIQASGEVDFGGALFGFGAPILGPDGDGWNTPVDYPAPELRKNSLICSIGGRWYQGGSASQFVVEEGGRLYLAANDQHTADNSRGWTVYVQLS